MQSFFFDRSFFFYRSPCKVQTFEPRRGTIICTHLHQDNLRTPKRVLTAWFNQRSLHLLQQNGTANGRLPPLVLVRRPDDVIQVQEEPLQRRLAGGPVPWLNAVSWTRSSLISVCSLQALCLLEEWHDAPLLGAGLRRFLAACCLAWSFALVRVCWWLWLAWKSRPGRKLEVAERHQ